MQEDAQEEQDVQDVNVTSEIPSGPYESEDDHQAVLA